MLILILSLPVFAAFLYYSYKSFTDMTDYKHKEFNFDENE